MEWLTVELKLDLRKIMLEEYGKSFSDSDLEKFANNYVQMIDMLDKANLEFEQRPARLVDLERKQ